MVKNKNANLTPNHFLDHNLCFQSPKWKWKHIFNIFHFKNFPMVLKKFKLDKFCTLKPCPKDLRHLRDFNSGQSGNPLEVLDSFPCTFHHFSECVWLLKHFPNPYALALVMSLRLGLWCFSKYLLLEYSHWKKSPKMKSMHLQLCVINCHCK
jgi:hypothetical protein